MDRARRTSATNRRKTLGDTASVQSAPADITPAHPAAVGSLPHTHSLSARGRQHPSRPHAQQPSLHRGQATKKRAKTMDTITHVNDDCDDDSPKKGGHTLRKRARVDYTFEHVDEEVVVPNSTSSRAKKRKSDNSFDSEDTLDFKGRGASLGADNAASVRRNPARKSVTGSLDQVDDEDVKDTIEVGVSFSDADESVARRDSRSSASSSAGRSSNGLSRSNKATSNVDDSRSSLQSSGTKVKRQLENNRIRDENHIDPQLRASPSPLLGQAKNEQLVDAPHKSIREDEDGDAMSTDTSAESISDLASSTVPILGASSAPVSGSHPNPAEHDTTAVSPGTGTLTFKSNDSSSRRSVGKATPPSSMSAMTHGVPEPTDEEACTPKRSGAKQGETSLVTHNLDQRSSPTHPHFTNPSDTSSTTATRLSIVHAGGDREPPSMDNDKLIEPVSNTSEKSAPVIPSISIDEVIQHDRDEHSAGPQHLLTARSDSPPIPLASASAELRSKDIGEAAPVVAETKMAARSTQTSLSGPSKPQPSPTGRWSYLTPYIDGEYISYPEERARSGDENGPDDTTPEDKDTDREINDVEAMAEDNNDVPDPTSQEAQTAAVDTPRRGSPVPEFMDPTAANSPAPVAEEADDGDISDSQEKPEQQRSYKYRKLRDPDDYISALENYENMSTEELHEVTLAISVSLVQWQKEFAQTSRIVDDYENSQRRRAADAKYEARTRNTAQHGVNYEEPDFVVKGYKAREKELMSETRYLQGQDRTMAAAYGFEYDPHPSKIGRQNPETQQVGIMTRGRSLRNQPKQTVKASEADEVTGKRQRKPTQLFDPAPQDVSRSSTPVPATRGRKRRHVNADEDATGPLTSSFNGEGNSDASSTTEIPKFTRRRGPRSSQAAVAAPDDPETPRASSVAEAEETGRSGRRRAKQPVRYNNTYAESVDDDDLQHDDLEHDDLEHDDLQHEPKQRPNRRLLTLKMPKHKLTEPSSAIADNGDSRPSTASSVSSSHTAESSYSFRPKRQKRFRDDPGENEVGTQAPPRKKGRRGIPHSTGGLESSFRLDQQVLETPQSAGTRKIQKIKVVRNSSDAMRVSTPSSSLAVDGDDKPKDYKNMTKSEKMSASMKSRWANGNMAGAVEKRKATLAAKKAAQVAADQKIGATVPKPKVKLTKKDTTPHGQPPDGQASAVSGSSYTFSANP